ncbi:hypothetical protein ATKI12_8438 [Kitasatospora sp. Ki12]
MTHRQPRRAGALMTGRPVDGEGRLSAGDRTRGGQVRWIRRGGPGPPPAATVRPTPTPPTAPSDTDVHTYRTIRST